ncbi:serine/threonine-protein kinase [Actinoplanes aureus]|uniref:mitogen-activated protein kinase kinase n=1 Tax=Actinoplanes aureus TaxID=2792083 RepID=A0A931CE76_9ACTN|nr:serine/threonine-protein kinase [Actinoplanes aureus]MBG0565568.1 protein kinase [Actinoplanes aureus]
MRSSLSLPGSGSGTEEPGTVDLSNRCVGSSYVLVCPVGQGATGTVWRGVDRSTGEQVAVKLLHEGLLRQPKLVTRFVQERTILMMVRHQNIVGVRDLFSVGESIGLVMDFVAGGSLRDRLRAAGTLPAADAARLLAQVAAALTETHALGVVHRDVKPDNVLLSGTGDDAEVRLTDFGIARVLDAAGLTTPHAIIGTPHYMAPETISGGDAAPSADVYALGITLYELVCGHIPYTGEPFAVLQGHLNDPPPRPSGMPDEVWAVIEECLDKDPSRRPTAAELHGTLRRLARRTAGVPALPVPQDAVPTEPRGLAASPPRRDSHRPARKPHRNGPRSWLWGRHGLVVALVSGSLAATGWGGYNAWQLREARTGPAPATAQQPHGQRGAGAAADPVPQPSPSAVASLPAAPVLAAGVGRNTGTSAPPSGADRPGAKPGSAAQVGITAGPGRIGATAGPGQVGGSVEFGPWQCGEKYSWDVGHPVLAQPCHALGPSIRVMGEMEAAPGVQADISLAVHDAETDEIVAGPYRCRGLMFTDFAVKHSCGPAELRAPRGRTYVVVETWEYTGRPLLPGGTIRGPEFTW